MPANVTDAMMSNSMLEINVDKSLIEMVFGKIVDFAKMNKVAIPDYLIPNEWGGPQDESYENFVDYVYSLYENMPDGITETYMHPSLETDDLKGTTGCWERRVWEYKFLKDPKTRQHIEAHGIKLINYRDLAEMRK